MRSELVFRASAPVPGRYELCQLTAKAGRKLHAPKNRIQDTLNDVLRVLARSTATAKDEQIGVKQRQRELATSSTLGIQKVSQIGHRLPQLGLVDAQDSLSADRLDRRSTVPESLFQMLVPSRNGVEEHDREWNRTEIRTRVTIVSLRLGMAPKLHR
jgi:hypothetical protein